MDITFLTSITNNKKPKNNPRRTVSLNIPDNLTPPVKLSFMRKRPISSFTTAPSRKLLQTPTSTNKNVGPGKYNTFRIPTTPSFEFPRSERFECNDFFAKFFLFKKLTDGDKKRIKQRIDKNKGIAIMTVGQRATNFKEKAVKKNFRLEITQSAKKKIFEERQLVRARKLEEKFRKHSYRMNLDELEIIKRSWILLTVAVSFSNAVSFLVFNKKERRRRSVKILKWFRGISRAVGKFKRLHIRIKYFRGMRVSDRQILKIYLLKYVKLWLKQRRKRHKKIIAFAIDSCLTTLMISNLINKWLGITLKIKRMFRTCVFFRLSMYQSLITKWNRAEFEILEGLSPNLRRKRRNISIQSLQEQSKEEGISRIPANVKLFYIKKYIQARMKKYISDYRVYKANFEFTHGQNKKNRFILQNNNMLEYPYPPEKPNIFLEFDREKLEELITVAMKEAENWSTISHTNQTKQLIKKTITGVGFL